MQIEALERQYNVERVAEVGKRLAMDLAESRVADVMASITLTATEEMDENEAVHETRSDHRDSST